MPDKEKMFEAEMTNQQLQYLQEYMKRVENQRAEVVAMKEALEQFKDVKDGDEILVPLAAGVFMKAIATDDKTLRVNVGQGTVVPKSVADMHQMLDGQLGEMKAYEEQLQAQFDEGLKRLEELEKELR